MTPCSDLRRGFTLLEVLLATVILGLSLVGLMTGFVQCQKIVLASGQYETAQFVLNYGEMEYPLPPPENVSGDILKNELINISQVDALTIVRDLNMDLPKSRLEELEGYTFERSVDEIDDDELKRNGYLYTIRTTIKWGGGSKSKPEEETYVRLWHKK